VAGLCGWITGRWFASVCTQGSASALPQAPGLQARSGLRCRHGRLGGGSKARCEGPGAPLLNLPLLDQGRRFAPPRHRLHDAWEAWRRSPSWPAGCARCARVMPTSGDLGSTRLIRCAAVPSGPGDTRLPGTRTGVECIYGVGAWLVTGVALRPPAARPARAPWLEPHPPDHPPRPTQLEIGIAEALLLSSRAGETSHLISCPTPARWLRSCRRRLRPRRTYPGCPRPPL
jgi:hypothetical protein